MNTIIAIIIVAAIVWYKFGHTILSLIAIIRHKAFTCNPKKTKTLTDEQQKLISAGLIIGEQNMFYIDSLETGASKHEQEDRLSSHWGISSKETAIVRLAEFGSIHELYDAVIDIYFNIETSAQKEYVKQNFPAHIQSEILEHIDALATIKPLLIEEKLATNEEEVNAILKRGTIAWDLGRVVYLARACFTTEYINEEQAWQYIRSIQTELDTHFTDWKSFGQSYMLGRSFWSTDDTSIDGLFSINEKALSSPESPWLKYPLTQTK